MKKLLILIFLLCSLSAFSQANLFSAGECITAAPPAFNPGARGCRTVLDTSTMHYWIWNVIPGWVRQEKAADPIVGCSAPLYTPTKWQSDRAINGCSPIPLEYKHVGAGVWECMNCASATVYTAGTGIAISGGNVISNTGDLSNTNEIQRIDTLSLSGNTLSASLLSDGVPASTVDLSSLTPSTEAIQDIAGGMVTGNVESLIAVTYDDAGGKIDFAVQPNLSNYTNDVPFLVTAVTSVGLDLPAELTEAGTPVTTTGTLSATWASQAANLVFRSGNAGGTPSFSALTAADISTLLPVANNGLSDNENGGNFRLGNRYMNGSDGLFSFDRKVNLNAFKFHMGDNTDSSLLVIDGTNDRIGIGTAAPSGKLHIGTGTNVGDFTTPAIILGTANNGIYVDIDRLFFKGGNLFGGGFAAGFFIGNGIAINTGATGGANNNLITPKFMPYRLSAAGLDAGLGGNAAGDISIVTSDLARVAVLAGGNVGMGTETPDRLLHAESSDAVTNAVTYAQRLSHITSGTATTGFGLGQEVELENGSGTNRVAATQEVTWSDAVDATEDATWKLWLIKNGVLTTALTVGSNGALTTGSSIISPSAIIAGAASYFEINGRLRMLAPSDGVLTLYDNAGTSFNRQQYGGITSSFPSWQRSGANLRARLADNSGDTDVEVLDEAYGAGWNASLEVPTKNAIYDKVEAAKPLGGSFAATGTATSTFTITIGATMPNTNYTAVFEGSNVLSAASHYVDNWTTTTFDIVYLTALTGAVAGRWMIVQH